MSNISATWAVFRTLFNVNMRVSYFRQMLTTDRRRLPGALAMGAALAWAGYLLLSGYVKLLQGMFGPLEAIGQSGALVAFAMVAAQVGVMIPGVFWVISSFYFSSDSTILASLPITARAVAAARMGVLLVGEYATIALLLVPAITVWGMRAGAGLPYWLSAAAVFLMAPAFPLAVSALAAMAIMAVANVRRHRTALMVAGSIAFFALYFWFQYWMVTSAPGGGQGFEELLASKAEPLMRMIGMRFPPAVWASEALVNAGTAQGLRGLAGTFAVTMAGLAAVVALSPRLVGAGLASMVAEAPSRRSGEGIGYGKGGEALDASGSGRRWMQRSPEAAIALRDMRVLFRTPSFALNALANSLIFPGLLAVWFLAGSGNNSMTSGIPGLEQLLASRDTEPVRALVLSGLLVWLSGMNMVAASAFSREGTHFWTGRGLPVPVRTIVRGKVLFAMAYNIAAAVPTAIVGQLILGLSAGYLAVSLAAGTAGLAWATVTSMAVDAFRPYLTWNHPQKAMKNSLNGIAAMLAVTGVVAGMAWLAMRAMERGIAGLALPAAATVLFAVMTIAGARWLFAAAGASYRRIEQ